MDIKRKYIIAGAAVVLLVIVFAVYFSVRRNSAVNMMAENEAQNNKDRLGIDYGGNFDEFNYDAEDGAAADEKSEDELQKSRDEETSVEVSADELIEELKKQRGESGFGQPEADPEDTDTLESDPQPDDETQDDEAPDDETQDDLPLKMKVIESKGYAQNEVLYNTDSEEDAKNTAEQISGKLESFDHGVAVISIEGSVDELLSQLEQNGSGLNLYRHYYY